MILITGCAGYIGSQLSHVLHKRKYKFIGVDNLKYSYKQNFRFSKYFYKIDISNKSISKILNRHKIDTVIHCAAYSYVMDGENNKKKYTKNNVQNTKKFINICKKNKIKNFIFLSSSNIYKDSNYKLAEKNRKLPINIYGKNKLEIENYLKKINFENYIILRLFNVVGLIKKFHVFKFKKKNYQRLFFKIIDNSSSLNLKYYIKNNLRFYPKRDFIDIKDLISIIIKILKTSKNKKINKTFNVGSGNAISIRNIINLFIRSNAKIKNLTTEIINSKELRNTNADINFAKYYFKWKPKVKIKDSVISTLKFSILK